jgi:hypothetical protein
VVDPSVKAPSVTCGGDLANYYKSQKSSNVLTVKKSAVRVEHAYVDSGIFCDCSLKYRRCYLLRITFVFFSSFSLFLQGTGIRLLGLS